MSNRVPFLSLLLVAGLSLLVAAPAAQAGSCIKEAKREFKDCKADCKEGFQVAKDACLNRDHACVELCRAKRAECREATGFDAAIAACNATLADAKAACRVAHPAGSLNRDRCIDRVQTVAFQCRDAAREAAKPALRQCRKDFRACAKACPPDNSPNPISPRDCKLGAIFSYRACLAICREDLQVAKDACRNRDHACVEQCRADREACRQPVIDQLKEGIAQCNATRDDAIDDCKLAFGEGTPERDTCIDNAQVAAFQCRDMKHEDARPGFQACRQAFRSCAEACPPAS